MKKTYLILIITTAFFNAYSQVTIQPSAGVYLQNNSMLTLQGNLDSRDNISGNGTICFQGTDRQFINTHGQGFNCLTIDNSAGVSLSSPLRINHLLTLEKGRLQCGNNTLSLDVNAQVSGGSALSFIETNGSGWVRKFLEKDLTAYTLPVGDKDQYAPVSLYATGYYRQAYVDIASKQNASLHKPESAADFVNTYWSVKRNGISGRLLVDAQYADVKGNEQRLAGYYWNGSSWSNDQAKIDRKHKTVLVGVPEGIGEIYAMAPVSDLEFKVTPNPVRDIATLQIRNELAEEASLQIFDGNGRAVWNKKLSLQKGVNQYRISVSRLARGHYTIRMESKNKNNTAPLIKG